MSYGFISKSWIVCLFMYFNKSNSWGKEPTQAPRAPVDGRDIISACVCSCRGGNTRYNPTTWMLRWKRQKVSNVESTRRLKKRIMLLNHRRLLMNYHGTVCSYFSSIVVAYNVNLMAINLVSVWNANHQTLQHFLKYIRVYMSDELYKNPHSNSIILSRKHSGRICWTDHNVLVLQQIKIRHIGIQGCICHTQL